MNLPRVALWAGGLMLLAGPVLAGWAGLGAWAVAGCTAAFLAWMLIMRPELRAASPGRAMRLARLAAGQLAVVLAAYGAGVLTGFVAAPPPALQALASPPAAALLSFLGVALARAFNTPLSPSQTAEIARLVDEFTAELDRLKATLARHAGNPDDPGPTRREQGGEASAPDRSARGDAGAGSPTDGDRSGLRPDTAQGRERQDG